MSSIPANPIQDAPVLPADSPGGNERPSSKEGRASKPFLAQAFSDASHNWGARLGTFWVSVIAFCAIFAPFLANSHPFAMKSQGVVSFPLFRYLQPVDVILPVVGVLSVILLIRRKSGLFQSIGLLVWTAALVAVFVCWPSSTDYLTDTSLLFGRRVATVLLWAGAVLLVAAVIGLPFLLRTRAVFWTALALVPLMVLVSVRPLRPSKNPIYETYRESRNTIEWAVHAPIAFSPSDRLVDQGDMSFKPPGGQHLMGTEYNGSDVLSRLIHACRIALAIGLISTGIARVIGILIGGLMGYFVGTVDLIGMRIIEVFEAIPTLFLLITFVAFYGRNLYAMMVIIGITGWTSTARFIRAEFLRLRDQDFVHAAIALGLPLRTVLFRHMLPNGITSVLVTTSFGIASAILYESTLSFLGLGLIDEPSWGQMLNQAKGVGSSFVWWIAIFPGLAIFFTVLSYNLIGEALRDAFDPKLRRAS